MQKSMNKLLRYFLILCIICITKTTNAQKTDVGNWFIYFGSQQLNKKWNWWNEVQYRNFNFAGDLEQLLLRTGLGYNLTENNNNVLLGYAFIYAEPYIANTNEKRSTQEHRLYQQFITRQKFGRVFIQHRYRLEERFLENDFRMRFRYFLALNIPLNKALMEKNAFYLSAYNEIFLHLDQPVFDRDRVYGALGYVFNNNFRAEVGMMTQIQETTSRAQFQIVLFNNLPLFKN
jgi:Protein of unknown function (DUF2490)